MAAVLPAAIVLLALASLLIAGGRPAYDPVRDSLSVLGERGAPGAIWFDSLLALTGLVVVVAGIAVARARDLLWVGLLIGMSGGLLVAAALTPVEPAPQVATAVHRSFTGAALFGLLLSPAVAARRLPGRRRFARWSAAVAALGLGGFALGAGLLVEGFPGGVWERSLFALGLLWVETLLLHLIAEA